MRAMTKYQGGEPFDIRERARGRKKLEAIFLMKKKIASHTPSR